MRNRMRGVRPMMSSAMPTIRMMVIAEMSGMSREQSKKRWAQQMPVMMPRKTGTPPKTGTGMRWSLRASGLSTRFLLTARRSTLGNASPVARMEASKGTRKGRIEDTMIEVMM